MTQSESKFIFKNSAYSVLYRLLNVLYPMISAAYVARILFVEGVGKVTYAQNIAQYFLLLAALGIPNYGIREIAKVRQNSNQLSSLFSELFSINFVSTTMCLIAYYSLIEWYGYFTHEKLLYSVVGISIVLNYINVDWFYQGCEEYKFISNRNLIVKGVSLLVLFCVVRTSSDYVQYAFISCLAVAGNNIFNIIHLKKYKLKFTVEKKNLLKHLKPIVIMFSTIVAIELYTLLDTTMLGLMSGESAVGYYSNSIKLVKCVITLISAIGAVLLPRLSFYYHNNQLDHCNDIVNKVFSVMTFFIFPCGIGLFLLADDIIPIFYGTSFLPAIATLKILSFLIFLIGFSNLFGTQVLITFRAEKKLLYSSAIGALTNIILNLFLIPAYQQNGAALASIVSEACVTILTYIFASKYISLKMNWRFVTATFISNLLLIGTVLIFKQIKLDSVLETIGSISCGFIVYVSSSIFLKNPIIMNFFKMLQKKETSSIQ